LQGSKNKQMHDTTYTHLAELRVHVEAVIQAKLEAHEQMANGYESAVFRHNARRSHVTRAGCMRPRLREHTCSAAGCTCAFG
jgi:hypothetical protein